MLNTVFFDMFSVRAFRKQTITNPWNQLHPSDYS